MKKIYLNTCFGEISVSFRKISNIGKKIKIGKRVHFWKIIISSLQLTFYQNIIKVHEENGNWNNVSCKLSQTGWKSDNQDNTSTSLKHLFSWIMVELMYNSLRNSSNRHKCSDFIIYFSTNLCFQLCGARASSLKIRANSFLHLQKKKSVTNIQPFSSSIQRLEVMDRTNWG